MTRSKFLLFLVTILVSPVTFAQFYFHIGGGLDYLKHDKSTNNYPVLNLKGGAGYKVNDKFGIELDITAESNSSYKGEGTCTTTISTVVPCTKKEEVTRQMVIGSAIYTEIIGNREYFVKGGLGLVSSSFKSFFESTQAATSYLADEKDKSIAALVNIGTIMNKKHRVGGIVSSTYGNSNVGKFIFFGIEYNYLINM